MLHLKTGGNTGCQFHFLQITERGGIRGIDISRLFEKLSGFLVVLTLQIEKCQKMIGFDKLRVLGKNLFQLNHSHVFIVLTTIKKRLVIFPDGLVDGIQFVFI